MFSKTCECLETGLTPPLSKSFLLLIINSKEKEIYFE